MKTPRISLHNPDILDKDELIAGFVARRAALGRLIDELRKPTPSHRLIVGPRGMGKSTLLQRLRHAVDDDPNLSAKWLPLMFREEQYNVARLSDLWLNALEAIANRLSEQGTESEADAIDESSDRIRTLPESLRAREALALLLAHGQKTKRRILLLIDNLDLLLHRLSDDEQWSLRETLSGEQLVLVGASVTPHPATFEYERPFYDFFRIEGLKGLTAAEATDVLLRLSVVRNTPEVREMLATEPGRIETLRQLTGGNPRAIVMVHQVLAKGSERDVVDDITALLDLSTPLYKARFEDLAPQSQLVIDALALAWDPQTTAMLSERLSLDTKLVAAQLSRLVDQDVVEKVPYPGRKTAFQISERLFNIWYLMRAGRRARRKLLWLVRFLESFYGSDGLAERAKLVASLGVDEKDGELLLAMSSRIDETRRYVLEVRAIELMARDGDFDERMHLNLDLEGEDAHLAAVADRVKRLNAIREKLAPLGALLSGKPLAEVVCGMPANLTIREGLTAQLVASLGASPDLRGYPVPPDASVNEAHARHIASGALSGGFDIENARRLRTAAPLAYAGVLRCCLIGARMEIVPADSWRSLIDDVAATEDVETWRLFLEHADASNSLDLVEQILSQVSTTDRTPQFWSALLVSVLLIRPAILIAERVIDSHPEGGGQRGVAEIILAPERDGGGGDFGDDLSIMYGEELERDDVQVSRWALIARGAVAVGDSPKLRRWLDQLTIGPELRPLREAVVAAIEGEEHLLTLAPEVRPAAQSLYRWITFRREAKDEDHTPTGGKAATRPKTAKKTARRA